MPRTIRLVEPHDGAIRWGIAATGRIAGDFATAFTQVDAGENASIAAVGSRSSATADAFAAEHDIARAHPSYRELAADPEVDVVYVASLQPGHMSDAITMLEHGKHVLVEKPFTLSATEAGRIFDAARANDRFAMEAMWMRFSPGPVEAVRRVHAGEIGAVQHMDIDFTIEVADDPDHRLRSLEKGGGALLDLGIYPVTLAWWIAGPPTSWTVDGDVKNGVDTTCVIEAEWDGITARLSCGLDQAGPLAATIRGIDGVLELPAPFHAADRFRIDGGDSHRFAPASLHHQVYEVNRCIRAGVGESPRNPWATTRAILTMCDEIRAELGVVYPTET